MDFSTGHSKRSSRGWWRLLSGVLLVFAATLGVGFYLPLRQTHELLKTDLSMARKGLAEVSASLGQTEATLQRVTAERGELEGFKAQTDAAQQRFPKLLERLTSDATPPLKPALEKKLLRAESLEDGLSLDWMSATLLNWKRSTPSPAGQKLLCPPLERAAQLGLPQVTVRTFAALEATPPDLPGAHTAATSLAITLTEHLVRLCLVPANTVSVTSSPAASDSPLVRFEFRPAPTTGRVGL